MSHETAYADTPCSAAIPITPDERQVLSRLIERTLAWPVPLSEKEYQALKGFLAKVKPGTEAVS